MSGYELKRKPGMTSIHAAYANRNKKSSPQEEPEPITPGLISELESKIKKLIRNVELFPANSVEGTLKKAREVEEKISEIINTMFTQIKVEAASAVVSNASKEYGSKVQCLATKNVDILLLRLGEVEQTLKKYANRVIKMKAFKVLADVSSRDKKSKNAYKYVVKCSRISRVPKNKEDIFFQKCHSKDYAQPKEVKIKKTQKTDKKKGKGK